MTRHRRMLLVSALIGVSAVPAAAYLKLGSRLGTRTVTLKWNTFPVRYFLTNRSVDGVSTQQFQTTVERAFTNWHAVVNTQTSSQFVGFTPATPGTHEGMTVLGFADRPDLDRVLGATDFVINSVTGEIVESDIFFNSSFPWSVATAGELGRYDLLSIVQHETGHLLGLSHSALGETELFRGGRLVTAAEAVMFPIAFSPGSIDDRTLKADDIAGISDIYGTTAFQRETGSVSGRVTKNGQGVLGAHVVAFNPKTGKLVGGFSLTDDGSFVIAALEPGTYVLRAEPLDDGDIESFFDASLNVDINFGAKFYERVVVVPRGGGTRNIEIKVTAK